VREDVVDSPVDPVKVGDRGVGGAFARVSQEVASFPPPVPLKSRRLKTTKFLLALLWRAIRKIWQVFRRRFW
jgi:hypothetical protein